MERYVPLITLVLNYFVREIVFILVTEMRQARLTHSVFQNQPRLGIGILFHTFEGFQNNIPIQLHSRTVLSQCCYSFRYAEPV